MVVFCQIVCTVAFSGDWAEGCVYFATGSVVETEKKHGASLRKLFLSMVFA